MKLQSIENINTALRFIDEHGVKLAGTGATEVCGSLICVLVCVLLAELVARFALLDRCIN